jgi:xylulose-5-phosphate/fructose-6-phosphate phosphoketolase
MNVIITHQDPAVKVSAEALAKTAPSLDSHEWRLMDAYRRAANYLSVGQIYLRDNPMLREPLQLTHVKPLVVGHCGTTPGQNFTYVHLNRQSSCTTST